MISCPDCQAENEAGAKTCRACGKELPAPAPSGELPLWLQALKPDHLKEAETDARAEARASEPATAESPAPVATEKSDPAPAAMEGRAPAPVAIAAETSTAAPALMASAAPGPAHASRNGTDTLVATQPTPAVRPVAPVSAGTGTERPANESAQAGSAASNETASLISEDDLPGWLRAFSENDASNKAANVDDQSWMLGTTGEGTADPVAENLAQSWQAPTRAATSRPSAANAAKVAKPERVIVAPTPAAAPEPAPATPTLATKVPAATPARSGMLPARPGANRPVPVPPARSGMSVQRIAVIAFLAALVIFLIVLGIFVVGPVLTK